MSDGAFFDVEVWRDVDVVAGETLVHLQCIMDTAEFVNERSCCLVCDCIVVCD